MPFAHQVVRPPLLLAPMAGLSHSALRRLLLELGGVGLLFTEMLAAARLPHESPARSPYLVRASGEGPLVYQLLVSRRAEVAPAVAVLHRLGADGIDLNLGCPAPNVRRIGGGGWLVDRAGELRQLVAEVRRRTDLPFSAKIRLGAELDAARLRELCLMLEGEGVDLLTVHARLRGERFCRKPRWPWVARVKSWLSIPVVANGGIFSVADAARCLEVSGADGLMLGRGAVRTPWLFADIAREIYGLETPAPAGGRPTLYFRFMELLEESFAPERRLGRLKEFSHYFAATYPFGHRLASAIQASRSMTEARERAADFFRRNEPDWPAQDQGDAC